jgi:ubiquitin-protein ligase
MARHRLRRELLNDSHDFEALGVALPILNNAQLPMDAQGLPYLTLLLPGAAHTPLQGTHWFVQVRIPQDYPFAAPLLLLSRGLVHHPHVIPGTQQWLPQRGWNPATTLLHLLLELQALLAAPELGGGAAVVNALAARQLQDNPEAFFRQLREYSEAQPVLQ